MKTIAVYLDLLQIIDFWFSEILLFFQAVSRGEGKVIKDTITLDVHAISDLESKKAAKTVDSAKYEYYSSADGIYGM